MINIDNNETKKKVGNALMVKNYHGFMIFVE